MNKLDRFFRAVLATIFYHLGDWSCDLLNFVARLWPSGPDWFFTILAFPYQKFMNLSSRMDKYDYVWTKVSFMEEVIPQPMAEDTARDNEGNG